MAEQESKHINENIALLEQAEGAYEGLAKNGYAVVPDIVPEVECSGLVNVLNQLKNDRENASTEGHTESTKEERRFVEASGQVLLRDCLLDRPEVLLNFVDLPLVTMMLSRLFGEMAILDGFSASTTYQRDPRYSHPPKIHIDSRLAMPEIDNTTHLATMICLEDFTESNGGIKIWPGSHRSAIVPHKDPHVKDRHHPGFVTLFPARGSLIFFLGQTWHQIGTSYTQQSRWSLLLTHTRWWIKPQTNYTHCGEKMFSLCTTQQKVLLGFASIVPDNRFIKSKTIIAADAIPDDYSDAQNGNN